MCTCLYNLLAIGSGYFASRGKIAPYYFATWRQNSPNGYFAKSAKTAQSLMLTQTLTKTLTLILTLIPTLTLTLIQTLTQTGQKHYSASRGKIATSLTCPILHFIYRIYIISTLVVTISPKIFKLKRIKRKWLTVNIHLSSFYLLF